MDNFLAQQKLGAADIAQGSFTLNRERALEIAKTLRLPEKRAYILKLVQSAVTAEASFIRMSTRRGGLVFRHNGRPPNSEEFEKLKMGVKVFFVKKLEDSIPIHE